MGYRDHIEIRGAVLNDAAAIADLSVHLGYPASIVQSEDRLKAILGSDEHAVIVACLLDGTVVGWAHVFVAFRVQANRFAELGGFVVSELYRCKGIGTSLFAAAEKWVAEKGIKKLRVRSRMSRVGAKAFYEKLGFSETKEQRVFDKTVGSEL
jgi:GNAT superfamily N-acetyltransferase